MFSISDCGFWSFSEPFDDAYVQNILRLLSSTFPQLIFLGCPPETPENISVSIDSDFMSLVLLECCSRTDIHDYTTDSTFFIAAA